jgi:hypothetical protein
MLWDITLCSPLKVNRSFGETCLLHFQCRRISQACFTLVSHLAYSWTMKMEATYSSETSAIFQWSIRCYIPEFAGYILIDSLKKIGDFVVAVMKILLS